MAHLNPRTAHQLREYAVLTALAVALVILFPIFAVLAVFLRGAIFAVAGAALAAAAVIALYHWAVPKIRAAIVRRRAARK